MSSLNPFAARRERGEAKMREKISELQSQHELPEAGSLAAGNGGAPMLTDAQLSSILPDRSGGYDSEDFDKYLPPSTTKGDQPATDWSARAPTTYEPPSRARQCMHRLQNAFGIGAALGGAVGFMYGAYAAVAYKHVLYLPIAVVQAAGGFGFFLACGTVIRCEELPTHEPLLLTATAFEMAARAAVEPLVTRELRLSKAAAPGVGAQLSRSITDDSFSLTAGSRRTAVMSAVMISRA